MKIISQNVIFLLFVCGVFGADKDEGKTVSVTEGDPVTLKPDLTEIHTYRRIVWRFDSKLIAQITEVSKIEYKDDPDGTFKGRLQLDNKTASLTITNMRRKHSGLYVLEAVGKGEIGTIKNKFRVDVYDSPPAIVVDRVEMKTESVKEGESLTLQTDVTEPHGDELIVWRFGDKGKLIAKHDIEAKSSPLYNDTDGIFGDRLKLDHQTGSLTISDIRNTLSGLYIAKISSSSSKQTLYKRFIVTVSDPGLSPGGIIGIVVAAVAAVVAVVMYILYKKSELGKQIDSNKPETVECKEGGCAVLPSYHEMKKGVQKLWTFVSGKESAVASMSVNDKKTYWYDPRFRGRLQLDPQTGSLIIRNLRKTDAGVYVLEIKSRGGTSYRKYKVTLSGEVETVSAKEGHDVTLVFPGRNVYNSNWEFGEENGFIATLIIKDNLKDNEPRYPDEKSVGRFRNRLELDPRTGSLTIKNIRPEHTGLYTVMTNPGYTLTKSFNVVFDDFTETSGNESVITGFMGRIQEFCGLARIGGVFGDEKDEMKTLPVMEGDDLNLNTETEIQTDDEIIVRFGTAFRQRRPYVTIARFSKPDDEFKSGERGFKDRLKLDLTGTLTITNFEITNYGDYYVQITNKKNKSFKSFTFIAVPRVNAEKSVTKGESIRLEANITNLHKENQMLWTFGPHDMIVANTTTNRCDNRFKDRVELKLDLEKKTGSLTISKSRTADAGMYYLQIISRHRVRNQTFKVTVNEDDASTRVKMSNDNESDEDERSHLRAFLDERDNMMAA